MSPLFLQRCLRSSQQDHKHPGSQVGEGARNLPFTGAVFIDPHFQYGPVSRPIAVLHTPNAQPVWISFPKETHLLQKPPVFNAPPIMSTTLWCQVHPAPGTLKLELVHAPTAHPCCLLGQLVDAQPPHLIFRSSDGLPDALSPPLLLLGLQWSLLLDWHGVRV